MACLNGDLSPRRGSRRPGKWPLRLANVAACALLGGLLSGAPPASGDLSRYRNFQLGSDVAAIAKETRMDVSLVQVVQQRPAVIQELTWRPPGLGSSSLSEVVRDALFSFYNGELFQITVSYDPYQTEGLNPADLIDSISAIYGPAARPTVAATTPLPYGDTEEVLAVWENAEDAVKLVRRSYGPSFALIATQKKLASLAQASILIAARLDVQEAPQREAARLQGEADAARAKDEAARIKNIANFRP